MRVTVVKVTQATPYFLFARSFCEYKIKQPSVLRFRVYELLLKNSLEGVQPELAEINLNVYAGSSSFPFAYSKQNHNKSAAGMAASAGRRHTCSSRRWCAGQPPSRHKTHYVEAPARQTLAAAPHQSTAPRPAIQMHTNRSGYT